MKSNVTLFALSILLPGLLLLLPIHTVYKLSLFELGFMDFHTAMSSYNLPYDTDFRAFSICLGIIITGLVSISLLFINPEKKLSKWYFWVVVLFFNFLAWGSTILSTSELTGAKIEWGTAQGILIVCIILQALSIYKHPRVSKIFGS